MKEGGIKKKTQKEKDADKRNKKRIAILKDMNREMSEIPWMASQGNTLACVAVTLWTLLRLSGTQVPEWAELDKEVRDELKQAKNVPIVTMDAAPIINRYARECGLSFAYAEGPAPDVADELIRRKIPFYFSGKQGDGYGHAQVAYAFNDDGTYFAALDHAETVSSAKDCGMGRRHIDKARLSRTLVWLEIDDRPPETKGLVGECGSNSKRQLNAATTRIEGGTRFS